MPAVAISSRNGSSAETSRRFSSTISADTPDDTRHPSFAAAQCNLIFPIAGQQLLEQFLDLFALARRAEIDPRAAKLRMLDPDDSGQAPERRLGD